MPSSRPAGEARPPGNPRSMTQGQAEKVAQSGAVVAGSSPQRGNGAAGGGPPAKS